MQEENEDDALKTTFNFEQLTIRIVNSILLLAGLTCIAVGCMMLIKENLSIAGTGLGTGLVLLLAATIDRFDSFKGAGIELINRKLEAKIVQADSTIKELRQIAELSGHTLSLLLSNTIRNGEKLTFEKGHDLIQRLCVTLKSLKCDERTIALTIQPWRDSTLSDLTIYVMAPVMKRLWDTRTTLINDLETQKNQGLENENTQSMKARLDILIKYLDTTPRADMLPIEKKTQAMQSYIANAPDLTDGEKEKYADHIKPWIAEIEFLITNGFIKTPHLWDMMLKNQYNNID